MRGVTLAALVEQRLNELGWSGRQAGQEAMDRGIPISTATINRIRRSQADVTVERMRALATLLELPFEDVATAANAEVVGPFRDELPRDVDLMTRAERDTVLAVIGQFIRHHKTD